VHRQKAASIAAANCESRPALFESPERQGPKKFNQTKGSVIDAEYHLIVQSVSQDLSISRASN
jgi:hypothetical protein